MSAIIKLFELILCIGVVGGAILYIIYRELRHRYALRLLEKTPTSLVGEVKENQFVKIKGNVICSKPLVTPEGNVKCVYYLYSKFQRLRKERGYPVETKVVDSSSSSVPFYLEDTSGKILVEPKNAKFEARIVYRSTDVHLMDPIVTPENEFVVIERGIRVGEPAVVLGRSQRKDTKLAMCKSEERSFVISNKIT